MRQVDNTESSPMSGQYTGTVGGRARMDATALYRDPHCTCTVLRQPLISYTFSVHYGMLGLLGCTVEVVGYKLRVFARSVRDM